MILAFSVLGAHTHGNGILGFRSLGGDQAVEAFFMISGFYMALVLNQKYKRGEYWFFIKQRFLRLWPLYFLVLILYVFVFFIMGLINKAPVGPFVTWNENFHFLNPLSFILCVLPNLTIFGQDILAFFSVGSIPANTFLIIGPAWSLGSEINFYLLAPYLVRKSIFFQGSLVCLISLIRFFGWHFYGLQGSLWLDRFFPFEIPLFLAGSIGYRYYQTHDHWLAGIGSQRPWLKWTLYFLLMAYSRLPGKNEHKYYFLIPALFIAIPYLFCITKNLAWDKYIGELSYPFYLIHAIVIFALENLVRNFIPRGLWGFTYALVTLILSWLAYVLIEKKIESYRHSLEKHHAMTGS